MAELALTLILYADMAKQEYGIRTYSDMQYIVIKKVNNIYTF